MVETKEGAEAPAFRLEDKDRVFHSLEDFKNRWLVLYFYPKDSTPGCTLEAKDFSKLLAKFEELECTIVGISGGDDVSKRKFCDKNQLEIILLSDRDFSVAAKYDCYGEKKFMGKTFDGILRKTFVISPKGVIVRIFDKVKVLGHAKEVLELIGSEQGKK